MCKEIVDQQSQQQIAPSSVLSQRNHARFFDFARLKKQIDADSNQALKVLHKRDSEIAALITANTPVARLLVWLDLLERQSTGEKTSEEPASGENVSSQHLHTEGLISFCLVVLGFFSGILSMSGLLLANNQQPVNILMFIGLFVGLQILLLLITLGSTVIPFGREKFSSPTIFLNPSALALKSLLRRSLASMPWDSIPQLSRLAILRWGQILGISFNVSLLGCMIIILALSDRSFGWSSTLSIGNQSLEQFLSLMSLPWSWYFTDAGITSDLISNTRFQSLQTQFDPNQITAMRQWWPFLLSAVAFYGLLPRIILFFVFHYLLKKNIQQHFVSYPGAALVLNRLATPLVTTSNDNQEIQKAVNNDKHVTAELPIEKGFTVINWAKANKGDQYSELNKLGITLNTILDAGLNLIEDKNVIAKINQNKPEAIIIAVKSWEPPLAELNDFLSELDKKIECYLLLTPLPNRPISSNEVSDWENFISSSNRMRLRLINSDTTVASKTVGDL